jgi:hypothetical protein
MTIADKSYSSVTLYELKCSERIENLLEFGLFIKAAGGGIYQLSC